ncbi:hypothetical protein CE91St23_16560 [Odoribacteraceae bacterium]|nr:hypothetical protein CE91St21_17330 [Odoribacteraceae bacterium]GKH93160.1 hypothetical protein CE91St23_16560 [Odoribacteraceae bacterium]
MANPMNVINIDSLGSVCLAMYAIRLNPAVTKLIGTIKSEKKYLRAAIEVLS